MTTRRTAQGMDRFIHGIIRRRKAVVVAFLAAAVVCAAFIPFVKTNYNMVDYLPDEAQSVSYTHLDVYKRQHLGNEHVDDRGMS